MNLYKLAFISKDNVMSLVGYKCHQSLVDKYFKNKCEHFLWIN